MRDVTHGIWYLYAKQEQDLNAFTDLVVRVQANPEALMRQIRAVVRSEDPNLAIASVATLGRVVDRSLRQEKMLAKLVGFFALLALILASIWLYGVMAYSVARRTNEIGIRMALGAQPRRVLGMVLGESALLVGIGLAVGLPAALACGSQTSSMG